MKKFIIGAVIFLSCALPPTASAQVPFGGFEVATFPCTCSAQLLHFFTPLFLGPVPVGGALTYPMGAPVAFAYWVLHPGAWALGLLTAGPGCWVWVGKACVLIPSLGGISPFTGTSP